MKIAWRINVPQVGFSYDFAMRGILALSALHMAHYKPEKRDFYIAQAMAQHQVSKVILLLTHLRTEDCVTVLKQSSGFLLNM